MLTKQEFESCAIALRNYWNWENELQDKGIHFNESKAGRLADAVLNLLTKEEDDWGFDPHTGMNWIVSWCSVPLDQVGFRRGQQWVTIKTAEDLWNFIHCMEESNWPKEIKDKRWLE